MCDPFQLEEYGLVGSFDTISMLYGDRSAFTFSDDSLEDIAFLEIQSQSIDLACQLYYRLGVRSGDAVVILCHNHAPAEVVAMLACARINAAFIPVDMNWLHKGDFLTGLLLDAMPTAAIVVAETDNDESIRQLSSYGIHRCSLLMADGSISFEHNTDVPSELPPLLRSDADLALYILYTSGSTGKPKGVMGSEHGLLSRIKWQLLYFPWNDDEIMCRRTPLVFIDSLAEIFGALLGGITIWVPEHNIINKEGIEAIIPSAAAADVNRLTCLPSQLASILRRYPNISEMWTSLHLIIVSGETTVSSLVNRCKALLPHVTLVNLYGSTELAGDVTYAILASPPESTENDTYKSVLHIIQKNNTLHSVHNYNNNDIDNNKETQDISSSSSSTPLSLLTSYEDMVPIGLPIEGNEIIIMKEKISSTSTSTGQVQPQFMKVSDGHIGEIFVTGIHVAIGYKDNTKKNIITGKGTRTESKERFLLNPIIIPDDSVNINTSRMRRPQDGVLFYMGRKDHQVKVRGVRMELEQIERILLNTLLEETDETMTTTTTGIAVICKDFIITSHTNNNSTNSNLTTHANDNSNDVDVDVDVTSSVNTEQKSAHLVAFIERDLLTKSIYTNISEFKKILLTKMSSAMIPSVILIYDNIPRTSTGKINRNALREQLDVLINQNNMTTTATATTSTSISTSIPSIEESPSGMKRTNPSYVPTLYDELMSLLNFFDLGGDSMLSVELRWRIRNIFGIHVSYEDLNLSLESLSKHIDDNLLLIDNKIIDKDDINQSTSDDNMKNISKKRKIDQDDHYSYKSSRVTFTNNYNTNDDVDDSKISVSSSVVSYNNNSTTMKTTVHWTGRAGSGSGSNSNSNNNNHDTNTNTLETLTIPHSDNDEELSHTSNTTATYNNNTPTATGTAISTATVALTCTWGTKLDRCVDASPMLVWRYKDNNNNNNNNSTLANKDNTDTDTSPTVYIGSHGGDFVALDGKNGDVLWSRNLGQYPHIEGSAVYYPTANMVFVTSFRGQDVDGLNNNNNNNNGGGVSHEEDGTDNGVFDDESDENDKDPEEVVEEVGDDEEEHVKETVDADMTLTTEIETEIAIAKCLGRLWALDASTGSIRWHAAVTGECKGAPVVDMRDRGGGGSGSGSRDVVWMGTHDHGLYKYDCITGELLIRITCDGTVFASPILHGTKTCIYAVCTDMQGTVHAFNTDTFDPLWNFHTGSPIFTTPILVYDRLIFGAVDGILRCLSATTGALIWTSSCESTPTRPIFSSPCLFTKNVSKDILCTTMNMTVKNMVLYGSHDGYVRCCNVEDGSLIWKRNVDSVVFSSPCVLLLSHHDIIIVATTAGYIFVLDGNANGAVLAKTRLSGEIYSSPVPYLFSNSTNSFYIGCRDDIVRCFEIYIQQNI
eukprot:gene6985-14199_t